MFVLIEVINKFANWHSYYRYLETNMTPWRKHLHKCLVKVADAKARTNARSDLRLFNTNEEFGKYTKYLNKRPILPRRNNDPEFMSNFGLEAIFYRMG